MWGIVVNIYKLKGVVQTVLRVVREVEKVNVLYFESSFEAQVDEFGQHLGSIVASLVGVQRICFERERIDGRRICENKVIGQNKA